MVLSNFNFRLNWSIQKSLGSECNLCLAQCQITPDEDSGLEYQNFVVGIIYAQ